MEIRTLKKLLADGLIWQAESPALSNGAVLSNGSFNKLNHPSNTFKKTPIGLPEIDSALQGGLRNGCVHEFCSDSYKLLENKSSSYAGLKYPISTTCTSILALQALKQRSHSLIIWIGKDCWPTPFILQSIENTPAIFSRCIFLDPPNRSLHLWAIESALRSQHVGMVVFSVDKMTLRVSRRLSLAARNSGATGVLLASVDRLKQLSAAHSRWQISPASSPDNTIRWCLELHALKAAAMPVQNKWTIEIAANLKFFEHPQSGLQDNEQQTVSINLLPRVVDSGSTQEIAENISSRRFRRAFDRAS